MTLDPRTPVLVGVAAVQQRSAEPTTAREPVELMIDAARAAAADAGVPALLAEIDEVACPRGFWSYGDAGRLIADAVGAGRARTTTAEVGVLQTTLFGRAAGSIAAGEAEVALVVGGEARHRDRQARRAGVEAPLREQPEGTEADTVLRPAGEIVIGEEVRVGLAMPVSQYALIENALRAAEQQGVAAHRDDVARLWAGMSQVAAANDDAWSREVVTPEAVRSAGPDNPMLAFPYTKRHNSQWNVDQAAALLFCSAAAAERLGAPRERWIFPLAVAESNHMLPLSLRRELHRSPGFAVAGARALERAGCVPEDLEHLELYSCFPSAVRVQQRELGLPPDRPVTVTGGMAFAGGPLNNFVLQAAARMARVLRADPGRAGAVTAVSGILTKQGVSLWCSEPRGEGFAHEDVSAETAARVARVELAEPEAGPARIASYTVLDDAFGHRVVLLCDRDDGRRALAVCADPGFVELATREEVIGRPVTLDARGAATPE